MTVLSRRDILQLTWRAAGLIGCGAVLAACGAASAPASASSTTGVASNATSPSASAASAKPSGSVAAKPASSASANASAGKLRAGYTALSAPNMPMWMADAGGGFRQRGLAVAMQFLDGSAATNRWGTLLHR